VTKETEKAEEFFREPQSMAIARAIQSGNDKQLVSLLDGGSDLTQRGDHEITLLHWAVYMQNGPALGRLMSAGLGAELWDARGETAAHLAAGASDPEYLQILLENGLSPNLRNKSGEPLLFAAIMSRRLPQLKLLIKHGADLNIISDDVMQISALHLASTTLYNEALLILLENGANPNIRNSSGDTFQAYFDMIEEDFMTDAGLAKRQVIRDWLAHNNETPIPAK